MWAHAEGSISTPEEHVLRGFFDRQSGVIAADKIAITKGSTPEVRAFAQKELEIYTQLANDMVKLYDQFKLVTRANPNNEYRPLEEGKSRGVTGPLAAGDRYSEVMFVETIKRPGGSASGYGAGGYSLEELAKLEGAAFDKQYLLLKFYGQQAMLRHSTDELLFEQRNPAMEAFARNAIKLISTQAKTADNLYRGQSTAGQNTAARGGARTGGAPGAPGAPGAAAGAPAAGRAAGRNGAAPTGQ
jgi:predicted outer membrane protein